ncbi:hypothetical protein, partial [Acinetobacter baumannii]|uniref:hypothetical protein n=1 Tax=Acinetobacter baumannii TaxID=470 RepID=UPI001C07CCEF
MSKEAELPRSENIVLVMIAKNRHDEPGEAGLHQFYMLACKKMQVNQRLSVFRAKYPDMEVIEPECDDPNAIYAWDLFKHDILTRENF